MRFVIGVPRQGLKPKIAAQRDTDVLDRAWHECSHAVHDETDNIGRNELRSAHRVRAEAIDKKLKDVSPQNRTCANGQTTDFNQMKSEVVRLICDYREDVRNLSQTDFDRAWQKIALMLHEHQLLCDGTRAAHRQ